MAPEYFVGFVEGTPVAHLCATPRFEIGGYRLTRLVVMPEWQGAGVGTKFLNWVAQHHLEGGGRRGKKIPSYFHTSHPQLCGYLKYSPLWRQCSAVLHGSSKAASARTICRGAVAGTGYGGHFRAVQGFKYIGK